MKLVYLIPLFLILACAKKPTTVLVKHECPEQEKQIVYVNDENRSSNFQIGGCYKDIVNGSITQDIYILTRSINSRFNAQALLKRCNYKNKSECLIFLGSGFYYEDQDADYLSRKLIAKTYRCPTTPKEYDALKLKNQK